MCSLYQYSCVQNFTRLSPSQVLYSQSSHGFPLLDLLQMRLLPLYSHPPPQWMARIILIQGLPALLQNPPQKYLGQLPFYYLLEFSLLVQYIVSFSMIFQDVLDPSRLYWTLQGSTIIFQNLLGHSRPFHQVLEPSSILQLVLTPFGTFQRLRHTSNAALSVTEILGA